MRQRPGWTARQRIDVGRELLHQLEAKGLGALRAELVTNYPLPSSTEALRLQDPEGARLLDIAAGRLPDGESLYRDVVAPGSTPTGLTPSAALADVLDAWRAWLRATVSEPALRDPMPPWDAERLESGFAVTSKSRATRLVVAQYHGDGLDWYDFAEGPGTPPADAPTITSLVRVPTPVRFRGMPNPRYWEFEDAVLDLGAVDAAPSDLARMAMLEFAFAYGNDVFALPVQVPMSSINDVVSLRVADTFGFEIAIPSAIQTPGAMADGWSFFGITGQDGSATASLLVPPVVVHGMRGPATEEAGIFRDEMANLVWAVERRVEGQTGRALPRAEAVARAIVPRPTPRTDAMLTYLLQTDVPAHWYPLPLSAPSAGPRMLRLMMLAPSTVPPLGRLLPPVGGSIHEEEVSRDGLVLYREYVRSRWIDGSTHVWARIRRGVGRGEGSSGLEYDKIELVDPGV